MDVHIYMLYYLSFLLCCMMYGWADGHLWYCQFVTVLKLTLYFEHKHLGWLSYAIAKLIVTRFVQRGQGPLRLKEYGWKKSKILFDLLCTRSSLGGYEYWTLKCDKMGLVNEVLTLSNPLKLLTDSANFIMIPILPPKSICFHFIYRSLGCNLLIPLFVCVFHAKSCRKNPRGNEGSTLIVFWIRL